MIEKLAIISVLTSLTTEATKKILTEKQVKFSSNLVASIISVIMTVGIQMYTCIESGAQIDGKLITETFALLLLSFLAATLSYDKVVQTLKQLST